jgi:NDP-sugar pyrophosphorylase family protein
VNEVALVVLCAGEGTRLRPVTERLPKALCTVGNRALVDWALANPVADGLRKAVNAHHLAAQLVDHVRGRDVHVSVESPVALGTAGALARLSPWLAGADVLVQNADAWVPAPPPDFVTGWDGRRPRLLVRRTGSAADFGDARFLGLSLLPHTDVVRLRPEPTGLYEVVWRDAWERGDLDLVEHEGVAFDVGTPERLLAANLVVGAGRTFVHPGARVDADLDSCVVLPEAVVTGPGTHRWSVCGPGTLTVPCDPDAVRREMAAGRGRP